MNDLNTLNESLTGFLKGEDKPTIQFEFTYLNLIFIGIMIIATIVVSQLIVKSLM